MALIGDFGLRIARPWLPSALAARWGALRARLSGLPWGRVSLPGRPFRRIGPALTAHLPKGLFARSILIMVLPMIILQSVVAYVFLERHWQLVTRRLSNAVTRDIAATIEVLETYPQDERFSEITRIAAETFELTI